MLLTAFTHKLSKLFTKIVRYGLVFAVLVSSSGIAYAKTYEEIEAEKAAKQEELEQLQLELESAEESLQTSESRRSSSLGQIEQIESELAYLEDQIKVNQLKQQQLEDKIELKGLEKEKMEEEQNIQIRVNYIDWKTQDDSLVFLQSNDFLKAGVYHAFLAEESEDSILGLAEELSDLELENKQSLDELNELDRSTEELEAKKQIVQAQIEELNNAIARARSNADGVRSKAAGVQQQIELLSAEQEKILRQDDQITGGNNGGGSGGGSGGGTKEVASGEFYFSGRGRDLYQGHGVGMSQFGAYGAALNGWSANKILTFYYTDTVIETRGGLSLNVQGYGVMSADDYAAGIGEVPSKACGTLDQIEDWAAYADSEGWGGDDPRRSKYVLDNPDTIWDCWPEEAIKAQVIAARSYGVTSSQPICTTAACQVYVGGKAKAWAAHETSNQYVVSVGSTHNGQIIRALYSSDNNQGYGTANNDTVWSNFSGVGTPYSYLRHVNDTSVAATYTYTNWTWRTNGYTFEDVNQLFTYAQNNYSYAASFITGINGKVGEITSLELIKDPSNRVRIVRINGTDGSADMAGWLFKAIWNDWVYNVQPTGEYDYIYSLTWSTQQG